MRTDDNKINNSGFRPQDIGATDGFPGYPYERTYANWDKGQYRPQGIPGLTNGANIEVEYATVKGNADVLGTITAGATGRFDFRLNHLPAVAGSVKLFAKKADNSMTAVAVDYVNEELGLVVFNYDNSASATPVTIVAEYKATGQIAGIPTGWDFKGSVGAVRILLQK
jgi:hypothetical protein